MLLPGNNSKCRFNVVIISKQQGMNINVQNLTYFGHEMDDHIDQLQYLPSIQ